jgi:cellulose biosynthesis protein BcsQ
LKTILIHSFKGGAGKTTIAVNLAQELAISSKVLLMETDFKMPSFFGIFENINHSNYLNDFYKDLSIDLKKCIYNYNKNYDVIFANPEVNPQDPVHSWDKRYHASRLRRLKEELNKLKTQYDYIIFDTPPGAHFLVINNIALADIAVIIVRPNAIAIKGTFKMIEDIYFKTKSPDLLRMLILFNQIPRVPMTKELNEWTKKAKNMKINQAGRIPCSCEGVYDMSKGKNLFESDHEIITYLQSLISLIKGEEVLSFPDPTLDF